MKAAFSHARTVRAEPHSPGGTRPGQSIAGVSIHNATEALVTHNVRDFREAATRFGFRVLLPRELLKELEP